MSAVPLDVAAMRDADAALARADAVMAGLIDAHGPCAMRPATPAFDTLVRSVVNQQLSQRAAATILGRVLAVAREAAAEPNATSPPVAGILGADETRMRAAGLSARKLAYLQGIARSARDGRLDAARWDAMSDAEVVADLTALAGIGRWTAEMFMMFCLRRADVVSAGDAGLRRAARRCYGDAFAGDDAAVLLAAAERWRPWRTVGCWHLWRSLDASGGALPGST